MTRPSRKKGSQFGFARMGVSRADEREGAARLADERGLPIAGVEFAAASHGLVRTSGTEPQRPRCAYTGAAARRIRGRGRRGRRGRGSPAARAPRKKAPRGGAQIRKVRTAFGLGAHGAQGVGPAAAQQGRAGGQFARAGRRARRFRRPRRDRQGQSRPGRDAVRTRTRARHQILARDRPCRRYRPLDERARPASPWSPAATPSASNC